MQNVPAAVAHLCLGFDPLDFSSRACSQTAYQDLNTLLKQAHWQQKMIGLDAATAIGRVSVAADTVADAAGVPNMPKCAVLRDHLPSPRATLDRKRSSASDPSSGGPSSSCSSASSSIIRHPFAAATVGA